MAADRVERETAVTSDHHQLDTYILYVVEAKGWTFASVLQRLR